MKGMMLNFASTATIVEAMDEYALSWQLEDDWVTFEDVRDHMADMIELAKGIPKEAVKEYLTRVYGAPQFKSPAQRRWYFATQKDRGTARPAEPKGARWKKIMEQAKEYLKNMPKATGEELVGAIDIDPSLTSSEEKRVRELVSPERRKKLVKPPKAVPKEEVTPETEELKRELWPEEQEEKERRPPRKRPSPGPSNISPLAQPGMPYVGASKYVPQKQYFLSKCPDIADGDHWRAFQQAVTLTRSGVEDGEVKEIIGEEYPEVTPEEILKAAKGYIREGSKDPYVDGRLQAQVLMRRGSSPQALAVEYSEMQWREFDPRFIKGFREGLPEEAVILINYSPNSLF